MVLFGLISGLSTGTKLLAVSWLSLKICVAIWLPGPLGTLSLTAPPWSLASASGTTLYSPEVSTTAKPCRRSAPKNWL